MAETYKVHPIAKSFPAMSDEEFSRLRESIQARGLQDPIWLYENKILDGRHRYKVCRSLKITPKFKQYRGKSPRTFVWDRNGARRNLNQDQLSVIALDLIPEIRETDTSEAQRAGQKSGGRGRKKTLPTNGGKVSRHANEATAKAAAKVGTSRRKVERAKRVAESDKQQAEAVRNGQKTLAQAEQTIAKEKKQREQQAKAKAATKQPQAESKVVCGDCLKELPKLSGVQTIIADPPYNLGVDYGQGKRKDQLPDDVYQDWCETWMKQCAKALTANGSMWIIISDEWAEYFAVMLNDIGLYRRAWIKWYETFGTNRTNNFNRTSRHIFYYVADPNQFIFNRDAILVPSARQTKYKDQRAAEEGKTLDDVWTIPRLTGTCEERQPEFPTQIPEEITDRIIRTTTGPGDLVVDPFSGSGTTGVSCRRYGRKYIGIEKSRKFSRLSTTRIKATSLVPSL